MPITQKREGKNDPITEDMEEFYSNWNFKALLQEYEKIIKMSKTGESSKGLDVIRKVLLSRGETSDMLKKLTEENQRLCDTIACQSEIIANRLILVENTNYLKVDQVGLLLDRHPKTIKEMIYHGKIKHPQKSSGKASGTILISRQTVEKLLKEGIPDDRQLEKKRKPRK